MKGGVSTHPLPPGTTFVTKNTTYGNVTNGTESVYWMKKYGAAWHASR